MVEVCKMRLRATIIWFLFLTLFGVLWIRTFQLQVIESDKLKKTADNLHFVYESLPAKRGNIYDRNNVLLAGERQVFSAYALPYQIQNKSYFAKKVAKILSIEEKQVLKRINGDHRFVWVKRNLSPDEVDKLRIEKIEGLEISREGGRYYPYSEICAHILGFVDMDGKAGSGIESYFDLFLRGFSGYRLSKKDSVGRVLWALSQGAISPKNGYDVYLTIDLNLQRICENVISSYTIKHKAKSAVAIVMDVQSNEILVLASYPTFNPNEYNKYSQDEWMNRAVSMVFEPGSSFKPIIMALALEDMRVDPFSIINCSIPITTPWGEISDFVKHGDNLSLPEILIYSSNIGISSIASKLKSDRVYEYLREMNFLRKVDIGLPGESSGILSKSWLNNKYGKMYVSFGQGIGVNAVQLISAYACIANGGIWKTPKLVKYIKDRDKIVYIPSVEERRVLSETTCNYIKAAMERVVSEGIAKEAYIPGYRIAGKTGTAEKLSDGDNSERKYYSQMVAFFPADRPRYLIFVLFDEPSYPYFCSRIAAPAIKEIITNMILLYNIPPYYKPLYSYPTVFIGDSNRVPNLVGLTLQEVYNISTNYGFIPEFVGKGTKVKRQYPLPGEIIIPQAMVSLELDGNGTASVIGLPTPYALSYMLREGYEYVITGDGDYVIGQSFDKNGRIILNLGNDEKLRGEKKGEKKGA
ncbi:MAG: penicillin-binding transpeptidase domain-containing protein [bacterium]